MCHILVQVLVIVTVASATYCDVSSQTILLNDGNRIPALALGTVEKTDLVDKVVKPAVIQAIESGYRHINTAAIYANEKQVGEAIADVISRGVVKREELWITTKLSPIVGTNEGVLPALQESLKRLNLDYVDLFLIHSPDNLYGAPKHDYFSVWEGMMQVKKLNLARSIGVSNFNSTHINRILAHYELGPSVNEIEVNPTFTNLEVVAYCQSLNITVSSYAPFGYMVPRPWVVNPPPSSFEDPLLKQIAEKHGKTTSQIVLRYLIDRGTIPMPKSVNPENIKMNIDVFDFQLTEKEVYSISELNQDFKVYYFDQESLAAYSRYYGF